MVLISRESQCLLQFLVDRMSMYTKKTKQKLRVQQFPSRSFKTNVFILDSMRRIPKIVICFAGGYSVLKIHGSGMVVSTDLWKKWPSEQIVSARTILRHRIEDEWVCFDQVSRAHSNSYPCVHNLVYMLIRGLDRTRPGNVKIAFEGFGVWVQLLDALLFCIK